MHVLDRVHGPRSWVSQSPAAGKAAGAPDLMLYVVGAMLLTYVWRIQDLFPVLAVLRPAILSLAAALIVLLLDREPAQRLRRLQSPMVALLMALLGIVVLGIPASLSPQVSTSFFLREWLPTVLLTLLVLSAVRSRRDVEWLLGIHLLGAFVFASLVYIRFDVGPDGRWGDLVYYDSNDLALLLVSVFPIGVFFVAHGHRMAARLAAGVCLVVFILALVKSGSRGGFIGFVVILLYLLLRFRALSRRARIGATVVGATLLVLVGSDAYWRAMQTLLDPTQDYNWAGQSYTGRLELWKRGVGYIAERPVLGTGVKNFPVAEGELSWVARQRLARGLPVRRSVAHNIFIEVGAELGLAGLAVFIALLWLAFRTLARTCASAVTEEGRASRTAALAQALTASLLGFIVCGLFISASYFAYLYVLLALASALARATRPPEEAPTIDYRPSARRAWTVRASAVP